VVQFLLNGGDCNSPCDERAPHFIVISLWNLKRQRSANTHPMIHRLLLVATLLLIPMLAANAQSTTGTSITPELGFFGCTNESLLAGQQHFARFLCNLLEVQTVGAPAATAGLSQLLTTHDGFRSGPEGYGLHAGVNIAGTVSGKFIQQYALPALFHQDERYSPSPVGTRIDKRIERVLLHSVILRNADSQARAFNVSAIPGALLVTGLSNSYQPSEQQTAAANATRLGLSLAGFVAKDAYAEFLRDLPSWWPGRKQQ